MIGFPEIPKTASEKPKNQTLRVTPAMEADVADHTWTIEEILVLVPEEEIRC